LATQTRSRGEGERALSVLKAVRELRYTARPDGGFDRPLGGDGDFALLKAFKGAILNSLRGYWRRIVLQARISRARRIDTLSAGIGPPLVEIRSESLANFIA
jgi:hypothetical protein